MLLSFFFLFPPVFFLARQQEFGEENDAILSGHAVDDLVDRTAVANSAKLFIFFFFFLASIKLVS